MEKKKSIFDNIRVPLEDLTEEESKALDNDPKFQEWSREIDKELEAQQSKLRREMGLDK